MEGIFPRSYVNVLQEKGAAAPPPPPTSYGNLPLEVSQSGSQPQPGPDGKSNKVEQGGKKFGKKMGNAGMLLYTLVWLQLILTRCFFPSDLRCWCYDGIQHCE